MTLFQESRIVVMEIVNMVMEKVYVILVKEQENINQTYSHIKGEANK